MRDFLRGYLQRALREAAAQQLLCTSTDHDDENLDAILTWRVMRNVSRPLTVLNDRVIYPLENAPAHVSS